MDHPRVCGEKYTHQQHSFLTQGSPPRVRGKGCPLVEKTVARRITPACAGKRYGWKVTDCKIWDHPRVCGEKTKKSP